MSISSPWTLLMAAPDPDRALLAGAKQGRKEAFDTLRRRYEQPLRGFVARRVGWDAADDLLQDIWLACWAGLPQYAGRSRFKAWLYGIAVRRCADYHRERARIERDELAARENIADDADAYHAVETRQAVREALARLPEAQREVVELYYYAELTLAEVAEALGRNLNTVKYQFYRAHEAVSQALKHEDGRLP